ncbi:MAG TPA: hypothetical protein VER03_11825 [Bryobacteraceae bacterium]|nr:hypothetical protein [Bryobacteraceae bacterium]
MASQDINSLAPTTGTTGTGAGGNNKAGIKDKVSDMASHAKTTAADWSRSATTAVDRNIKSAAGALESTASTLRERAPGSGKVNEIATATADKIETTARYLREHDTRDMVAGVESIVRRNPGPSLAAALAVGFLIGTAMRKDREY